jgi:type I restriction enzyme, S subunit
VGVGERSGSPTSPRPSPPPRAERESAAGADRMTPDALPVTEPNGWIWAPLGQLGSWIGGGTPSKSNAAYWANGSIPWVSPKDMKAEIIQDTEDHITEVAVVSSATKFVPAGSVLMVMRSGILRHTFPVAVSADRVTVNQDLRALIPVVGINPRYVAHYLRGSQRQVLDGCSKDGTTVQSIEVSALERVRVPVAPTAEQQRIVARIDELFAEIGEGEAALQRARQGLATWRRALLKAAVTGELTRDWREQNPPTETGADLLTRIRADREAASLGPGRTRRVNPAEPLDTAALPELPEGWVWGRMGRIALSGGRNGVSLKGTKNPPGVAALRLDALAERGIEYTRIRYIEISQSQTKALALSEGDFLISRANGSEHLVGRARLVRIVPIKCVYPDTIIRYRIGALPVLGEWLELIWESALIRDQIRRMAKTTAGILKISQADISQIWLPVPPLAEMAWAVNLLSSHAQSGSDVSDAVKNTQKERASLRQSILKAAFEGRLVAQDPADEPASIMLARLRQGATLPRAARRRRPGAKDAGPRQLALSALHGGEGGTRTAGG